MQKIQFKGANKLNEQERSVLDKLSEEYFGKIGGFLKDIKSMKINIKLHNTEGKRKRYQINIKVISAAESFDSKVEEWDLAKVLHKGFKKILHELKHKHHSEGKPKKLWHKKSELNIKGIFEK